MAYDERGLEQEIAAVINRHCAENGSHTPDFILASYLMACLRAFDEAVGDRARLYGTPLGSPAVPEAVPESAHIRSTGDDVPRA